MKEPSKANPARVLVIATISYISINPQNDTGSHLGICRCICLHISTSISMRTYVHKCKHVYICMRMYMYIHLLGICVYLHIRR